VRTVRYEQNLDSAAAGPRPSPLDVILAKSAGRWYVTSSHSNDGPTITIARPESDRHVAVEAVPLADDAHATVAVPAAPTATAEVVGADGDVVATDRVALHEGAWRFDLAVETPVAPAAVRVTVDDDGDDVAPFASAIVLPAETAHSPAEALFPVAMPVLSYDQAWTYTLTHPDDPRSDWRRAVTDVITSAQAATPPAPTFDHVVTRADRLELHGRFATADGGAGTFELARLKTGGPWFLVSLKDDAITVLDTQITPTRVNVTMTVRDDYTLGVGGSFRPPAGKTLAQVWGKKDHPVVFAPPFTPAASTNGVASHPLLLQTIPEGHQLRYYDAWPRPH
jgi:hypothetical protein